MLRGSRTTRLLSRVWLMWIAVAVAGPRVAAIGQESWIPIKRHFEAKEAGESCIVYQSVRQQLKLDVEQWQTARMKQKEMLKQNHERLMACARENGLRGVTDQNEIQVAVVCSPDYDSWLEQGVAAAVTEQDIVEAEKSLKLVDRLLTHHCPKMPEATKRNVGSEMADSSTAVQNSGTEDQETYDDIESRQMPTVEREW